MQVLQQATEPATRVRAAAALMPAPDAWWEAVRKRNATLDSLFYDVGKISLTEAQGLAPWLVAEGAILLVPPSGGGDLRAFDSVDDFDAAGGTNCRALTVAGVGSSALGAAAFARNVADAVGDSVAAVVSGYGLADVITEGAGGWFWFGTINRLRRAFQTLGQLTPQTPARSSRPLADPVGAVERTLGRDLRTAIDLLTDARFGFDLVVGHSKGNLVLSEALFAQIRRAKAEKRPIPAETLIVTMSAAITMPPAFHTIVDVMGDWDWFGRLNSDAAIPIDVAVPQAWHHTNTELENHLPVTEVLRGILADHERAHPRGSTSSP
jgi:hypothetical protein